MESMLDTPPEPVIICGIENEQTDFEYTMDELGKLAAANNMQVVGDVRQKLEKPVAATYFGSGKAEEIGRAGTALEAATLVVNDELTPTQIRNLEDITHMTVMDRTALILAIFASRAHTREAKIQVKIAQLQYQLPRLHTAGAEKLDQQSAGGMSNRGSGETQHEMDRRVIEKRISALNKELKDIDKEQQVKRKLRDNSGLKSVALVGYTNAGKSTTMNGLLNLVDNEGAVKSVFTKDMLFATLDTAVRRLKFADNKEILLSDTVGFVSKLPHQLVKAFRSTLAEAAQADLLVQVIDASDPHAPEMVKTTERTLKEIGVTNIPMIYAYNKADKTGQPYPLLTGQQLTYSAQDEESLRTLITAIKKELFKDNEQHTYLIPFNQGRFLELLNEHATIMKTAYEEDGTRITAEVSPEIAGRLQQFIAD